MNVPWKPIKSAPDRLIRAYQGKEIQVGRTILGRLLSDTRMRTVWPQLAKYVKDDQQWLQVLRAIINAKSMSDKVSKLRKTRGDERDGYAELADKFKTLAKKVEGGPLDVLAYELLPQDVLAALHVPSFSQLDALKRSNIAHQLLPCWPSATELLRGLEALAMTLSIEAMTKSRTDERSSGDVAARTFVCHLRREFRSMFDNAMLGTLASIANATFDKVVDEELSRSFVQSALKGV
jgi:hypothetical protein